MVYLNQYVGVVERFYHLEFETAKHIKLLINYIHYRVARKSMDNLHEFLWWKVCLTSVHV